MVDYGLLLYVLFGFGYLVVWRGVGVNWKFYVLLSSSDVGGS